MAADPLNYMGHPIPDEGRQEAYSWLRFIGLAPGEAWEIVGKVARALERDEPFRAQRVVLESRLDLTAFYRLVAMLLVSAAGLKPEPSPSEQPVYGVNVGLGPMDEAQEEALRADFEAEHGR